MSLVGLTFKVRWITDDGKHHQKLYDTYASAQKALKWLQEHGIMNADLAVALPPKPEPVGTN